MKTTTKGLWLALAAALAWGVSCKKEQDPAPAPEERVKPESPPIHISQKPDPTGKKKPPIRCQGDQKLTLTGQTLKGKGPLIIASGDCQLTLEESGLVAEGMALHALDRARVTVKGGEIVGIGKGSVVAMQDAVVSIEGAFLKGVPVAVAASGRAKVTAKGCTIQGSEAPFAKLRDAVVDADGSNKLVPK